MARMTKDELERRLALAKSYGATPEQIEQKKERVPAIWCDSC